MKGWFSWTCLYDSTKDFKQDLVSGSCQFCWKSQMWCQVFTRKMSLKHGYHESIHGCFKVGEPQKFIKKFPTNLSSTFAETSWIVIQVGSKHVQVSLLGKRQNIRTLQGTRKHIPPYGEVWKVIDSKSPTFRGGYVIVRRRVLPPVKNLETKWSFP